MLHSSEVNFHCFNGEASTEVNFHFHCLNGETSTGANFPTFRLPIFISDESACLALRLALRLPLPLPLTSGGMGSFILVLALLVSSDQLRGSNGIDTLTPTDTLTTGQTLVSASGLYELGFFTAGTATPLSRLFLGLRHHNIPDEEMLWVANRQTPITGANVTLSLTTDGNLLLHDNVTGGNSILWSTNTSGSVNNPTLKLLDSGNLVLTSGTSGAVVWQSFDQPSNVIFPGMELGWDLTRGIEKRLISWQTTDDPSPGIFTYAMRHTALPELVLRKGSSIEFRTGPWDGIKWSGLPLIKKGMLENCFFEVDSGKAYFRYESVNKSVISKAVLSHDGEIQMLVWVGGKWWQYWKLPQDKCDEYGTCGAFGICNIYYSEGMCNCLRGFEPRSAVDWTLRDYSGGCKRRTPLGCNRDGGRGGSGGGRGDGFVKVSGVKVPDTENVTVAAGVGSVEDCWGLCLTNCSCVAYTVLDGKCLRWTGELLDIKEFDAGLGGQDVYLRLAASELDSPESGPGKAKLIVLILIPLVLVSTVLFCFGLYLVKKNRNHGAGDYLWKSGEKELDIPFFDMSAVEIATDNFCNENKLGEGGFGVVYKGRLGDGQEIAVKRLSRNSVQGLDEFMNEVMLIAKLQHRNLVRLLGCCIQREERLLIYEYMPNRSLDAFIFDKANKKYLDWRKRFEIILGITRGLLYLHQDSRLKIVHRDLKLSNVLLDKEMNPKISDFGMARIVSGERLQESTEKVVGTYGYMSPEYAMHGFFSVKSDVFSFGVIVLEILTGKKNRVFDPSEPHASLIEHAWRLWSENRSLELVVDSLEHGYPESEVLRCFQVGLLCVQERSDDRPTMDSVLLMLGSEGMELPKPKRPGFYQKEGAKVRDLSTFNHTSTVNEVTVTMVQGR